MTTERLSAEQFVDSILDQLMAEISREVSHILQGKLEDVDPKVKEQRQEVRAKLIERLQNDVTKASLNIILAVDTAQAISSIFPVDIRQAKINELSVLLQDFFRDKLANFLES